MFTGIIEEIGKVRSLRYGTKSIRLWVNAKKTISGLKIGDSIAVNGVCLTIIDLSESFFCADVAEETLKKTTLGSLKIGEELNLERALGVSERLNGHITYGHVDNTGVVKNILREANSTIISIAYPKEIRRYLIPKGAVAIDGVSLTVADINQEELIITLIPHTLKSTIFGRKKISDKVNIEVDIFGKYVESLLFPMEEDENKINKRTLFLKDPAGFFEWTDGPPICN